MIESFLTYIRCELNLSAHTVLSYSTDLNQWRDYATGGRPETFQPLSMAAADIRQWILALSRQGMSPRSLRRKLTAVRAFYRFLMRRRIATVNPAADIDMARIDKPLPAYVRLGEINEILDQASARAYAPDASFEEVRNALMLHIFYATGMRRAELIGLLDVNVDVAAGELKVLGKRNKERIICFGSELSDMISHYRHIRAREVGTPDDRRFFCRHDGRPLYPGLVERVVKKALAPTHAEKQSPHVLRHTFATHMLNAGADITSVRQLLGHASLEATQIYTHLGYNELKNIYQHAHPRAHKHL